MNKSMIPFLAILFGYAVSVKAQSENSNILNSLMPQPKTASKEKQEPPKDKVIDFSKAKVLPLTKAEAKQIDDFNNELNKTDTLQKQDEFESIKDLRLRRKREREKLLKAFSQKPFCKNLYEIVCKTRRDPRLYFKANSLTIDTLELNDVLMSAADGAPIDYLPPHPGAIKNAQEVDFAGIIKTKKDQIDGYQEFKCSVAEARQIKKNLGNSWKCKMKLWLRFNPECLEWDIVKAFIMPATKTSSR